MENVRRETLQDLAAGCFRLGSCRMHQLNHQPLVAALKLTLTVGCRGLVLQLARTSNCLRSTRSRSGSASSHCVHCGCRYAGSAALMWPLTPLLPPLSCVIAASKLHWAACMAPKGTSSAI